VFFTAVMLLKVAEENGVQIHQS